MISRFLAGGQGQPTCGFGTDRQDAAARGYRQLVEVLPKCRDAGIIALAARYKLPAVYPFRYYVSLGGLISYGSDIAGQFRPAAAYVDRVLKGEKPADLPVQAPTKYELVINLNVRSWEYPPSTADETFTVARVSCARYRREVGSVGNAR
jgi:ABC transporter substrate binding protein